MIGGLLARARPGATAAAALATVAAGVTLLPLFESLAWVGPTLLAVAAMAATGMLGRAISLPLPLQPILQLLVLLTLLTVMFAQPAATLGFLPGPTALEELQDLTRSALVQADALLSPVPATPRLIFLSVGGIGLVAMTVDTIGVSLRLPALAGIPLLLMYALPAAVVRGGVPWWMLPIAVVGWLLLLAVDHREDVVAWGRALGRTRSPDPNAAARAGRPPRARAISAGAALQVGLIAVVVALLLPAAIPGLREPVWVSSGGPGSGTGSGPGSSVVVDPFVSLQRDLVSNSDREILRYRTSQERPGYLRLVTLDSFDGVTWTSSQPQVRIPASEALGFPDAPAVEDVRQVTHDIRVTDLDNPSLPVPYAATVLRGEGEPLDDRWSWDALTRTVSGTGVTASDTRYSVTSYDLSPTREELREATGRAPDNLLPLLRLPEGITPRLTSIAQRVTEDARTPYARALALVRWFTRDGGFQYSTDVVTPPGADPLESFLQDRTGYCQQFAGTMALMARSLGIPARVSVGFTGGREVEDGVWQVQARNAHAWPELWFEGVGWVWFEPTPRSDAGAGVTSPEYTQPRGSQSEEPSDTPSSQSAPIPPEERGGSSAPATTSSSGPTVPIPLVAILVALLAAAVVAPIAAVSVRRRRRTSSADPRRRIEGAWAELGDEVRDFGYPWSPSSSPRHAAARVQREASLQDDERRALTRLVWWLEHVRYASPSASRGLAAPTPAELRADLGLVRRALRRKATRGARLRALLAPRSLVSSGVSAPAEADVKVPQKV